MTADGTEEYIQNCGHGDLFQDTAGAWWAVVLAVRNEGGRFPLGRETFLTPVEWPENGWPKISQPKMEFERESIGAVAAEDRLDLKKYMDPMHEMIYIRDPIMENYRLSADTKTISLRAGRTEMSSPDGLLSFVGRRQTVLKCTATTVLMVPSTYRSRSLKAGLTLYKDSFRHASIYLDFSARKIIASFVNGSRPDGEEKKERDVQLAEDEMVDNIDFVIVSTRDQYHLQYRRWGEGEYTVLLEFDAMEMTARDFTGTLFGVFAIGDEDSKDEWVEFEKFEEQKNN